MQEIKLKKNKSGLRVYINDLPNFSLMPKIELDVLIVGIELQISEYFKNKKTNLTRRKKS